MEDKSNEGIVEGRPSKGVAILWKNSLSNNIDSVYCNERIIGVIMRFRDVQIFIVNVYLPCDKQDEDSLDEFRNTIATLDNFLAEHNCNNVLIAGDFNASPNKGRFWTDIFNLLKSKCFIFSDVEAMPNESFTYLCPARNTTSWLDHIAVSESLKEMIDDINIRYDMALYDHFPLACKINIGICNVGIVDVRIEPSEFIDWQKLTSADNLQIYKSNLNNYLHELDISRFNCLDCCVYRCDDEQYIKELNVIYNSIISLLLKSSSLFKKEPIKKHKVIPGWNDEIKDLHKFARNKFLAGKKRGRPISGVELEEMKKSRTEFRNKLKQEKNNESQIRKNKLAQSLSNKNFKSFWKEVRQIKNNKVFVSMKIDGECDPKCIVEKFSNKFKNIYDDSKCQNDDDFMVVT